MEIPKEFPDRRMPPGVGYTPYLFPQKGDPEGRTTKRSHKTVGQPAWTERSAVASHPN
jgi:hypothetical protein